MLPTLNAPGLDELSTFVLLKECRPKPRTSGMLRLPETVPVKVNPNGVLETVAGFPGVTPTNPSSVPESSDTNSFLWALASSPGVQFLCSAPTLEPYAPGGL